MLHPPQAFRCMPLGRPTVSKMGGWEEEANYRRLPLPCRHAVASSSLHPQATRHPRCGIIEKRREQDGGGRGGSPCFCREVCGGYNLFVAGSIRVLVWKALLLILQNLRAPPRTRRRQHEREINEPTFAIQECNEKHRACIPTNCIQFEVLRPIPPTYPHRCKESPSHSRVFPGLLLFDRAASQACSKTARAGGRADGRGRRRYA